MADKSEAAEARHRLANIFQLLSTLMRMRIQRTQDDETRRQMNWMLDTVTALGFLHRRAPGADGGDFGALLREMAPTWQRRCEGTAIRVEVEAEALAVTERDESALMLITHELVANAIAHGFPGGGEGLVRVSLARAGAGRAELAVVDNGRGYDAGTVTQNRLGLWLIKGLASQAQATVTTSTENGVAVRLNFALPEHPA
jgi:two-component sensor histidine kinase